MRTRYECEICCRKYTTSKECKNCEKECKSWSNEYYVFVNERQLGMLEVLKSLNKKLNPIKVDFSHSEYGCSFNKIQSMRGYLIKKSEIPHEKINIDYCSVKMDVPHIQTIEIRDY